LDEREDSINDGFFVVDMRATRISRIGACESITRPAITIALREYLLRTATQKSHRWLDPRTIPAVQKSDLDLYSPSKRSQDGKNNRDIAWLQDRSTRFKN